MSAQYINLFSPGPVPLSEASLKIMGSPPIHHRSAAFKEIIKTAHHKLGQLLGSPYSLAFTSSGSGALESSLVNLLSPKDSVICLEGGKFGERWQELCEAYQVDAHVISFPWGETPPLKDIEQALKDQKHAALYMQACETSTGTMYPVSKIVDLIKLHSPETLLVVDGITAVGAYPIFVRDGIDLLITGSQKALSLATGMSFIGLSEKALEKTKTSKLPKYYFDYAKELESLKKGITRFSCSTQLWECLNEELKSFENLETKYEHCLLLQKMVHSWCQKEGLTLFSKNPSPSLTAVYCPQGLTSSSISAELLKKGHFVAGGQGEYKDKIFRIGHMGHISKELMENFLKDFSEVLSSMRSS